MYTSSATKGPLRLRWWSPSWMCLLVAHSGLTLLAPATALSEPQEPTTNRRTAGASYLGISVHDCDLTGSWPFGAKVVRTHKLSALTQTALKTMTSLKPSESAWMP